MTIAELFVKLGVKGGNESKKEITGVSTSLKDVSTAGLQAKAMILGVVYGLQQMMSKSMATGKGLQDFATMTGLSAERLQRWQYAARQVGVSSEEVLGGFKQVQGVMSDIMLGKGVPEGWGLFMDSVMPDPGKLRDTEYMMAKLQEFAQKVPADVGNKFLQGFGLNEGMIVGMRRNAFTEDMFKKAPILSDGQTKQLAKVGVMWDNLGAKAEMLFAKLNAKHGAQLVRDISKVADQVFRLIDSLMVLADKMKIFEAFGTVLQGWTDLVKFINDESSKDRKESEPSLAGEIGGYIKSLIIPEKDVFAGDMVKPSNNRTPQSVNNSKNENNATLVMNVGDRSDLQDIVSSTNTGLKNLFNQMNARVQEK